MPVYDVYMLEYQSVANYINRRVHEEDAKMNKNNNLKIPIEGL